MRSDALSAIPSGSHQESAPPAQAKRCPRLVSWNDARAVLAFLREPFKSAYGELPSDYDGIPSARCFLSIKVSEKLAEFSLRKSFSVEERERFSYLSQWAFESQFKRLGIQVNYSVQSITVLDQSAAMPANILSGELGGATRWAKKLWHALADPFVAAAALDKAVKNKLRMEER